MIRFFILFAFTLYSLTSFSQEKFERTYRSFTNQHLSTSMTAIGSGYGILSTQRNFENEIETVNILTLDTKGKVNWSNTYEFDDSISYIGEILRLADGGLVFSSILDKDSLNKVISYVEPGGALVWRHLTGQLTDVSSLAQTRSTFADIPGERFFHAHVISDSITPAQTIIQLSSYLYDGTSEFTRKWTGEGQGAISIQDMITTADSSLLILGQSEDDNAPFFLAKLDKEGELIWTKSYKNNFGALEEAGGYRVTELVDSSFVVLGSLAPSRGSVRGGFVLNVSDRGEILKGYRINSLRPQEDIYPTNLVGLKDKSIVIGIKRLQQDGESVFASMVNFDLDSIISYQTSLDTSVAHLITESGMVSVDSTSVTYLTTLVHDLTEGLTPYISKIDRDGTTYCEESIDVVSFDSLGWSISDTVDWMIRDMALFVDSTDVIVRPFAGFDPPNKQLQDTTYCPNDQIMYIADATIRGGVAYIWDDGNMDSIRLFTEAGTFSVTMVVREDICFNQCDTLTISVAELPMVTIIPNRDNFCTTGELLLIAQPMGQIVSFEWNDGTKEPFRAVSTPGTYSVMVVDNCMEAALASITLTDADFTQNMNVAINKSNANLCTDGTIVLTAVDVQDIEGLTWSNGLSNVLSIAVSQPGEYTVFKDGFCTISGAITLTDADFDVTPTVSLAQTCTSSQFITISSTGTNITLRRWSNDATTASIQVTDAGTYSLTATGPCGDEVTVDIEISENDITNCIVVPPGQVCLRFPNVFIPSDDEILNKSFGPQVDCDVDEYELHIYNRWGADIWTTDNLATRWDGDLDGDPAPGDVYFWWAKYLSGGDEIIAEGDITLIR